MYSLNMKQKVALKIGIKNVIKRARQEETIQVIGYIGGPGSTGKSQVIRAVVDFHKEIKFNTNSSQTCQSKFTIWRSRYIIFWEISFNSLQSKIHRYTQDGLMKGSMLQNPTQITTNK